MFDLIIKNLSKIANGKPDCHAYFCTTDLPPEEREIKAAFSALKNRLQKSSYFQEILVESIDRDRIIDYWQRSTGALECTLPFVAQAAFPKSAGIDESYVVTVKAKDFVDNVLYDELGNRRVGIFDGNVRDFSGGEGNVNSEIGKTLNDRTAQERFGILNNGITIVAPDIRTGNQELFMKDFQIVNGCQTSNMLIICREKIEEKASLMLKVVKTSDPDVIDEIVRATNNQNKVDEHQFLATLDAMKSIERYFKARADEEDYQLYFERRSNQFREQEIKKIRIFDIKDLARAAGSMFFDRPELATRYPNQLTSELREIVFSRKNDEEIFYTAAFALYRLKLNMGNKKIAANYSKYAWFMLMGCKCAIAGNQVFPNDNKKVKTLCRKIYEFSKRSDEDAIRFLIIHDSPR